MSKADRKTSNHAKTGDTMTERILKSPEEKQTILSDPILSRLRLNDQFGKPIKDMKNHFRDCQVVGFFFANIWRYNRGSMEDEVLNFCQQHPHRFKCIYVSVDSKEEDYQAATRDKPWVNMIWNDGSNPEEEGKTYEKPEEEFLTPADDPVLREILAGRLDLDKDSRPISRVGLCHLLNISYSPTLVVYHLETKTWLDYRVRKDLLTDPARRELTWEAWQRGERMGLSWNDILHGLRWAILFAVIGIIYRCLVYYDESFKAINIIERMLKEKQTIPTENFESPKIAEYVEF